MPKWITSLNKDHWLKSSIIDNIKASAENICHLGLDENIYILKDIVSRKKQLIPLLSEQIEKLLAK